MSEKCVCHINGYQIKDSVARKKIEDLTKSNSEFVKSTNENFTNINNEIKTIKNVKLYNAVFQVVAIKNINPNIVYVVTFPLLTTDVAISFDSLVERARNGETISSEGAYHNVYTSTLTNVTVQIKKGADGYVRLYTREPYVPDAVNNNTPIDADTHTVTGKILSIMEVK